MLTLMLLGCAGDPDPARGRWVGEVTAYESEYYADLEDAFVGSAVELRLTNTDDGTRVSLLTLAGDSIGYLGDVMTGDPGSDELGEPGATLALAIEGEQLTAIAAGNVVYTISFEASRVGDLTAQDPDLLDGQWLVRSSYATSDCDTVDSSEDDAISSQGLGELSIAATSAVWEDPIERVSVEGTFDDASFTGNWSWDAESESGDTYNERVHVELDLDAGTGTEWARQTGVPCYGYNLRLARLLDRLEAR